MPDKRLVQRLIDTAEVWDPEYDPEYEYTDEAVAIAIVVEELYNEKRFVSQGERVAAAKARIVADQRRNIDTPQWIKDLAES